MKGIAAMDLNRGIGYKDRLPWPSIKEDMNWFRKCTVGNNVVFGKKTFLGIPESFRLKMVKDRKVFILTRDETYSYSGVVVANNIDDIPDDCWVAGGAQIYNLFMPRINTFYITLINGTYSSDTYMPDFESQFKYVDNEFSTDLIRVARYSRVRS